MVNKPQTHLKLQKHRCSVNFPSLPLESEAEKRRKIYIKKTDKCYKDFLFKELNKVTSLREQH